MDEKQIEQLVQDIDDLTQELIHSNETPSLEVIQQINELEQELETVKNNQDSLLMISLGEKLDTLTDTIRENKQLSTEAATNLLNSISGLQIPVPQVTVTVPDVIVPEIKLPDIKIPPSPPPPAPIINNPDSVDINEPTWLDKLGLGQIGQALQAIKTKIESFSWPTLASKPISVRLSDGEKFYRALGGGMQVGGGGAGKSFKNSQGTTTEALADDNDSIAFVQIQERIPTYQTKLNPVVLLDKNSSGDLVAIRKIINGKTYTKTFSNDDSFVASTQTISSWS